MTRHSQNPENLPLREGVGGRSPRLSKRVRPPPERRVYVLPAQLVQRILQYAVNHDMKSEVEAARALLEIGLTAAEQAP